MSYAPPGAGTWMQWYLRFKSQEHVFCFGRCNVLLQFNAMWQQRCIHCHFYNCIVEWEIWFANSGGLFNGNGSTNEFLLYNFVQTIKVPYFRCDLLFPGLSLSWLPCSPVCLSTFHRERAAFWMHAVYQYLYANIHDRESATLTPLPPGIDHKSQIQEPDCWPRFHLALT